MILLWNLTAIRVQGLSSCDLPVHNWAPSQKLCCENIIDNKFVRAERVQSDKKYQTPIMGLHNVV